MKISPGSISDQEQHGMYMHSIVMYLMLMPVLELVLLLMEKVKILEAAQKCILTFLQVEGGCLLKKWVFLPKSGIQV